MKIDEIRYAHSLYLQVCEIDSEMKAVSKDGLGVTIRGRYQDDELVDHVRQHVLEVLNSRRMAVFHKLEELGVCTL